jgi:hypothetical protein
MTSGVLARERQCNLYGHFHNVEQTSEQPGHPFLELSAYLWYINESGMERT